MYHGGFLDGKYDGQGSLITAVGDCYRGEFKDGARNGWGTFWNAPIMPDGERDGKRDGGMDISEWRDGSRVRGVHWNTERKKAWRVFHAGGGRCRPNPGACAVLCLLTFDTVVTAPSRVRTLRFPHDR